MTSLWKVGVLLLFVVALLPALNLASANHSQSPTDITNESITVDYSSTVAVDETGEYYSDTATIRTSDGSTLTEGTDYTWNASSGEVTFQNTTATTDGEQASIDYASYSRAKTTSLAANILGPWGKPILLLLVFMLVYGAFRFATEGGGGGGL